MIENAKKLKGELELLGDKSLAHRAMLFASLASGKSTIENFPDSGVSKSMLNSLENLGINAQLDSNRNVLLVNGNGFKQFPNANAICDCGNSATTMRLLTGALVSTNTAAIVTGSDSLCNRPIRVDSLIEKLGYKIETNDGKLPMHICESDSMQLHKNVLIDTEYKSAQVKSALILASLGRKGQTTIVEQIPTRDHTERMLQNMGAKILNDGKSIQVNPLETELNPISVKLPGDISSAAFLLVAAAIVPNSDIIIKNVLLNDRRTGYFSVLQDSGCQLDIEDERIEIGEKVGSVRLRSPSSLNPVLIESESIVSDMIDEFPAIAALMACTAGKSAVKNATELRYKESDRIRSIVDGYRALGISCNEMDDGFTVIGNRNFKQQNIVKTRKDHRIAMAFQLLNLINSVEIDDRSIIAQSFPNFEEKIQEITC